uniref:Uncharacterized protein n=1 Tax=Cacopsylla melanoneura TaxID=428564 RepID=A0A8D9A5G8_9HEMI
MLQLSHDLHFPFHIPPVIPLGNADKLGGQCHPGGFLLASVHGSEFAPSDFTLQIVELFDVNISLDDNIPPGKAGLKFSNRISLIYFDQFLGPRHVSSILFGYLLLIVHLVVQSIGVEIQSNIPRSRYVTHDCLHKYL